MGRRRQCAKAGLGWDVGIPVASAIGADECVSARWMGDTKAQGLSCPAANVGQNCEMEVGFLEEMYFFVSVWLFGCVGLLLYDRVAFPIRVL